MFGRGVRKRKQIANKTARTRERSTLFVRLPLLAVLLFYVALFWAVIVASREVRIRSALEHNQHQAQLRARLLDEQSLAAVAALRLLGQSQSFEQALQQRYEGVLERDMRQVVDQAPDLVFVATYEKEGRLISKYPDFVRADTNASRQTWFREIRKAKPLFVSEVIQMPGKAKEEVIALTIPVGNVRRPAGYLFAYYRVNSTEKWLRQMGANDKTYTTIMNLQGRAIAFSSKSDIPAPAQVNAAFLNRAASEKLGTAFLPPSGTKPQMVTGYALAAIPRWVVLVSQPADVALSSITHLIWRFALLSIPVVALLIFAARKMVGVYEKQEGLLQRLADQNQRLQTSDQAKSDFLAAVSHDLWTPLATVQLSISGLMRPNIVWTPEQSRDSLALVNQEVEHLIARVRNLLEMARLDMNEDSSPREPSDLQEIVRTALDRMRPFLGRRQIRLNFPALPLMIDCHAMQMEIVIINLLENALKYSPAGSSLYLCGEYREQDIFFSLRDQGIGVKDDEAERLFDKFYRAPNTKVKTGIGLGLALCKAIIERHDGLIGVLNAPGGGAEFWFSVPAMPLSREQWK